MTLQAQSRGITTSINTQFDSTEKWLGIKELCPYLTVFLGNELESVAITTSNTTDYSIDSFTVTSSLTNNTIELTMAAATLLHWGCRFVVITQG